MHSRCFLLHAACLVTGLMIGLGSNLVRSRGQEGLGSDTTHSSKWAAPRCTPPELASAGTVQNNPLLLANIRTAVREELRAELATHRSQVDEAHTEERPSTETLDAKAEERRQLAYQKASQSLRNAIGYGTWTQEDRQQLRSLLHELSVPQQDQLIGELFGAIQSGRLHMQGSGPPL